MGCSYGGVTDAKTGVRLGGARISARALAVWRPRQEPMTFLGAAVEVTTWAASMAGHNGGEGIWYLNHYAKVQGDDATVRYLTPGWTRFLVSRAGYDSRSFVRNHQYSPCGVSTGNPYSAGPYPFVYAGSESASGYCARQDFALDASSENYPKAPDMIVDPRALRDWSYTTVRGVPRGPDEHEAIDDCEGAADACVRVAVVTPNVGIGDLFITAPIEQQDQVTQHRFNRLRGLTSTRLDASFVRDGHPHLHLANWTRLRLRKMDASCGSEATAERCPELPTTARKVSFCLMDSVEFEAATDPAVYRPNQTYTACDTLVDGRIEQGIRAGWSDVYRKDLAGQFLPADGLHGEYWLEVEVNPADERGRRTIIESDYTNNVSRIQITIP